MSQQATAYCSANPSCTDSGYYVDGTMHLACDYKRTYSWACIGFNDENTVYGSATCDFREVVNRSGYNGITSYRDLSYGNNGWYCY